MSEVKVGVWLVVVSLGVLGVAGAVVALSPVPGSPARGADGSGVRQFAAQRSGADNGFGASVSSSPQLVAGVLSEALEKLVAGTLGSLSDPKIEIRLQEALQLRGWGDDQARARAASLMFEEMKGANGRGRSGSQVGSLTAMQRRAISVVAARLAQRLVNNEGDGDPTPGNIEDINVPIAEGYTRVHWQVLGGFDYTPGRGELPPELTQWDAHPVALVGYMLPVGVTRGAKKFLLVESLWGCCFGAVPAMNQVVDVQVADAEGVDYRSDPVVVMGTLEVGEQLEDGAVISLLRLRQAKVVTLAAN